MDDWLMPGLPRTIAENADLETVRRIRASVTSDTGQVVESDLLLDCPFCGGHATSYGTRKMASGGSTHCLIHCDECSARLSAETEAEAVSAWNRRAERACRVVSAKECGGVGYAPGCSECGWQMAGSMWHNYCPNCGARVLDEEVER